MRAGPHSQQIATRTAAWHARSRRLKSGRSRPPKSARGLTSHGALDRKNRVLLCGLSVKVMRQPAPPPKLESLSGLIERVTFFNEESGFAVLKVKAKGHRDLVTVVGSLASVSAGEWVTAEGRWVHDREFGLQFKAEMLNSTPPTTKEGIEKYLGSGMVKGIGPVYAKK